MGSTEVPVSYFARTASTSEISCRTRRDTMIPYSLGRRVYVRGRFRQFVSYT
jgi:hypothetical protein